MKVIIASAKRCSRPTTPTVYPDLWNKKPRREAGFARKVTGLVGKLSARLCSAWFGDVDLEFVLSQVIVMEHADGLIGIFLGGHGHEGKAL